MSDNIEQKIIKTVAETLGADSLDLVELMMAIEAAFECDIPDDKASKITTVADAVKYVETHINA